MVCDIDLSWVLVLNDVFRCGESTSQTDVIWMIGDGWMWRNLVAGPDQCGGTKDQGEKRKEI